MSFAACADPENFIRGGPDKFFLLFFQPSTYFTEGLTNLLREAIGPEGVQLLLEGGPYDYSKETYRKL